MIRAEKLVSGLGSEAERWNINADKLQTDLTNLTGNILLAAAFLAYLGPFTLDYRINMLNDWKTKCIAMNLPTSEDFSIERILT